MPISSVAVGDLWTAAEAMAIINQLNGASTFINFIPAANTDTPSSGTTPTTWITLGNVTVPSWASSAVVTMSINGFFEVAAGTDNVNVKIGIGTALGVTGPRLAGPVSAGRGSYTWTDGIASVPTGSQSVIVQATRVSGTSVYRVDGACIISAQIAFLP